MTKQTKSGEPKIDVSGDVADLKPGESVAGYEYASNLNAQSDPIIDPGTGKTVSIRVFEFRMNPAMKHTPTQQQLFDAHARQIQMLLWGDGLIHLEEISPRVIIDKKKGIYQIFVACEARLNTMFMDKPRSLSEILKPNGTTRNKK